jgi:hypothetical protein
MAEMTHAEEPPISALLVGDHRFGGATLGLVAGTAEIAACPALVLYVQVMQQSVPSC